MARTTVGATAAAVPADAGHAGTAPNIGFPRVPPTSSVDLAARPRSARAAGWPAERCMQQGRVRAAWRPAKPLCEGLAANFSLHFPAKVDTRNLRREPHILDHGRSRPYRSRSDHQIDVEAVSLFAGSDRTPGIRDRGHSLTIDTALGNVATACPCWLNDKGLSQRLPQDIDRQKCDHD